MLSSNSVCFGCNGSVGLEEPVEECYVIESERQAYLFDLQIGEFEFGFGIGDDCLNDEIACSLVADLLDGCAQVRQSDMHDFGVLGNVVPLVVMLEYEVTILVVDLVLAILWTQRGFGLRMEEAVVRHLENVVHVDHLFSVKK